MFYGFKSFQVIFIGFFKAISLIIFTIFLGHQNPGPGNHDNNNNDNDNDNNNNNNNNNKTQKARRNLEKPIRQLMDS